MPPQALPRRLVSNDVEACRLNALDSHLTPLGEHLGHCFYKLQLNINGG